jgi:site-specific recombinase XerD
MWDKDVAMRHFIATEAQKLSKEKYSASTYKRIMDSLLTFYTWLEAYEARDGVKQLNIDNGDEKSSLAK